MLVLVVEDEPLIRMLAADILAAAGHLVHEAMSAAAAIHLATQRRFDVAVIDLGLPDSTCAALLQELIEAQPGLGIVISTGRQPDDPLVAAARWAARGRLSAVLTKPWTEPGLLEAVAAARATDRDKGFTMRRLFETGLLTVS